MTLGIGSLASASSIAFCKPSLNVAPVLVMSKNRLSALPSFSVLKPATAETSKPMPLNRLSKAGEGLPSVSKPTLTGISFCATSLSAALDATSVMCAANRRGVAKLVTTVLSLLKPCAFSVSANKLENDKPNFLSAFGGSSSTNNSTNRLLMLRPSYFFSLAVFLIEQALHLHGFFAPSGSPSLHDSLGSSLRHCVTDCGCGPYR